MKMKTLISNFVAITMLITFCQLAKADNREGAFVISPGVGPYLFDTGKGVRNNAMYNLGLGYDFNRNWGIEALAGVVPTSLKGSNQSVRASLYSIDGIYHFSTNIPLVPYLLAGAGVLDFNSNQPQLDTHTNLNAGAGLEYFLGSSVALRSDVRDIYTVADGRNDVLVNFGVSFLLGGRSRISSSPIDFSQPDPCVGTKMMVRFTSKSTTLDPIYMAKLQQVTTCMQTNQNLKLNLDGYANCFTGSKQNLNLSQQRAEAVKQYLVAQAGINPDRINAQGFGEANSADDVVVSLYGKRG